MINFTTSRAAFFFSSLLYEFTLTFVPPTIAADIPFFQPGNGVFL